MSPLAGNLYSTRIRMGHSLSPSCPFSPVAATEETANPGDPLGDPQKYYLIAYKDRSIYSALAYWLEGNILHYVTTQNTHNQASLDLIDLEQTTRLNADKNVPFTLTAPLTGK